MFVAHQHYMEILRCAHILEYDMVMENLVILQEPWSIAGEMEKFYGNMWQ